MSSLTTLGQLVADGRLILNDGYRTKRAELGEPGIPILRVAEVLDESIAPALGDYVREEYRRVIGSKTSRPGDVIVTTKGTVGRVAIIRESMAEFVYSPQLCFFRPTPASGIDSGFLYQWFRGREFQHQALSVQSQTDMAPYINLSDLRRMTITLPSRSEQRAIADTLGALDDKIESNRRLLICLERLSRAEVLRAMTAADGGGFMRRVTIGDLANQIRETVSAKEAVGQVYIGLDDMPRGRVFVDAWGRGDHVASQKWAFQDGDVLFGKLRPYFKKVGIVPVAGVCSTDMLVLRPKHRSLLPLVLAVLASDDAIEFASSASTGTRMPRASWEHLASWKVDIPSESALAAMSAVVTPMLDLGRHVVLQSRSLVALRNALLPELLSGRLRAGEARGTVEAVV